MEQNLVVNPETRQFGAPQADNKFHLVDKLQRIFLQKGTAAIDSIRREEDPFNSLKCENITTYMRS